MSLIMIKKKMLRVFSLQKEYLLLLVTLILSSLLEYYDFAIFVYLAPWMSQDLISLKNPSSNLLLTYSFIDLAAIVRLLGGIFFGHHADKKGGKKIFFSTLLMMALSTAAIAFIPSASFLGKGSMVLLLICRIWQSFSLGGELPSAVVLAYELSPKEKKISSTTLAVAGTNLGFLLASLVSTLLLKYRLELPYGWRMAFVLGGVLGFLLLYLRSKLFLLSGVRESSSFQQEEPLPLKSLFSSYKKASFIVFAIGAFCSVALTLYTSFSTPYLTLFYHFSLEKIMELTTIGLILFSLGSLCSLWLKNCFQLRYYLLFYFLMIVVTFVLFSSYPTLSLLQIMFFQGTLLFFIGIHAGRFPFLAVDSFPQGVRYRGVALTWNLSLGLITSFTQFLLLFLIESTHLLLLPAYCFALFTLLAIGAILLKEKKGK